MSTLDLDGIDLPRPPTDSQIIDLLMSLYNGHRSLGHFLHGVQDLTYEDLLCGSLEASTTLNDSNYSCAEMAIMYCMALKKETQVKGLKAADVAETPKTTKKKVAAAAAAKPMPTPTLASQENVAPTRRNIGKKGETEDASVSSHRPPSAQQQEQKCLASTLRPTFSPKKAAAPPASLSPPPQQKPKGKILSPQSVRGITRSQQSPERARKYKEDLRKWMEAK
eukprot:gene24694-29839_t